MSGEPPPEEVQALLARRAERVRAPPVAADAASPLWVAEFPLGEARYAVRLDQLRAAVPLRAVTPVPLAPPHVIGILRFQGQMVTALSLASLLGGSGWKEDPAVLLVVDLGAGSLCALDCEQIPKPVSIPQALVDAARGAEPQAVTKVTLPGPRELFLLELPLLLARFSPEARRGA